MKKIKVSANQITDILRKAYNAGALLAGEMRSEMLDWSGKKDARNKKILEGFKQFSKRLSDEEKQLSEDVLAKKWLEGWKDAFFDDPA